MLAVVDTNAVDDVGQDWHGSVFTADELPKRERPLLNDHTSWKSPAVFLLWECGFVST